jgi:hypothetical protein
MDVSVRSGRWNAAARPVAYSSTWRHRPHSRSACASRSCGAPPAVWRRRAVAGFGLWTTEITVPRQGSYTTLGDVSLWGWRRFQPIPRHAQDPWQM